MNTNTDDLDRLEVRSLLILAAFTAAALAAAVFILFY